MSEYLELPDLEGSVVSKGDQFPEGHVRPDRTAKPLSPGKKPPTKSNLQKVVEVADDDVVAAREEKERKAREKNPAVKRKTAASGKNVPKRRKHLIVEEVVSSEDKTLDVNPINQAEPHPDAGSKKMTLVDEDTQVEQQPDGNLAEGAGQHEGENPERSPKLPSHGMQSLPLQSFCVCSFIIFSFCRYFGSYRSL